MNQKEKNCIYCYYLIPKIIVIRKLEICKKQKIISVDKTTEYEITEYILHFMKFK